MSSSSTRPRLSRSLSTNDLPSSQADRPATSCKRSLPRETIRSSYRTARNGASCDASCTRTSAPRNVATSTVVRLMSFLAEQLLKPRRRSERRGDRSALANASRDRRMGASRPDLVGSSSRARSTITPSGASTSFLDGLAHAQQICQLGHHLADVWRALSSASSALTDRGLRRSARQPTLTGQARAFLIPWTAGGAFVLSLCCLW